MTDLTCTEYSEKAIVVRGNTKDCKEELKKLGGKYNANLRDGAGWIFPKKSEDKIKAFMSSGKVEERRFADKRIDEKKVYKKSITNSSDLLKNIEEVFRGMNIRERLELINEISNIALNVPERFENVQKIKVTLATRSSSSEEEQKEKGKQVIIVDSEDDDTEVDTKPVFKRLLK